MKGAHSDVANLLIVIAKAWVCEKFENPFTTMRSGN